MVFLKYKNGSNLESSLLSTIQSYVANPSKMKKFLITLRVQPTSAVRFNKSWLGIFETSLQCFNGEESKQASKIYKIFFKKKNLSFISGILILMVILKSSKFC